jgi:glycosyltransferase involved in cell wall biosynthesis
MKIVFNTKSLLNAHQQDKYFLHAVLKRMIIEHGTHEFIIMTDHADTNSYLAGKNVTAVITRQPVHHPLLRKLWFDLKLPAILKKYQADVFVSADGFCSLPSPLPQCLLLYDLTFFYNPAVIRGSALFFYNRSLSKFLNKAKTIATVSASFKKELSLRYKTADDKIEVVYPAAKETFLPVDESVKEETKRKYCDGKSYFIYTQGIHSRKSLITLLKAFSLFKKRQKSNWKLLITGRMERDSQSFTETLKTYKYRDDIVLTGFAKEEDMIKLIGSAYALIHSTPWDGTTVSALEAMNCRIPVIASAVPFIKEIAGDAVLYANSDDHTDIAEKMMVLYKDETLRNSLIDKGQTVVAKYNWDKTADLVWQIIQKAYASSVRTHK